MKKSIIIVGLLPIVLFANEGAHEGTDIVARVINFAIFAGILYYLVADKIKAFFTGRTQEIAQKLSSIEKKIEETKKAREEAQKKLEESKEKAAELVEIAKKEAKMQIDKMKATLQSDIEHLHRAYESKKEIAEKKMKQEVVAEVIDELFGEKGIKLTEAELVKIINKKVA